jgi:hypothetical protein
MSRFGAAGLALAAALCAAGVADASMQREMQIYKVTALGLEIWVENQPAWETELSNKTGRPIFVAQSPDFYHPPVVMTYASWPKDNVAPEFMRDMAVTAIRRASENFGLNAAQARGIQPYEANYGDLRGFEGTFEGVAGGMPAEVRVFVGQAPGKFPVALSVYTLRGKLNNLNEPLRRSWGKVKYLAR